MNAKKIVTSSFVAGAVALALAGATMEAKAEGGKDKEKCFGVVKSAHNDCANAAKTHSCMGQASVDGDGGEWVALPKGVCEKLAGGSLAPYEGTDMPEGDHKG